MQGTPLVPYEQIEAEALVHIAGWRNAAGEYSGDGHGGDT